ncbi:MAG: hypothetical protein IT369_17990 [Candidatus Latescibacteria bacterium]|nr:hypothetical protein [Candidatus Latescibacterota bacterium]
MASFLAKLSVLVLLGGCAGAMLPPLSPAQIEWAGQQWRDMGAERLEEARLLYVIRCSGCHNLFLPTAKETGEWEQILPKMAERAKLTDVQRNEIWRYLQTARSAAAVDTTTGKADR